MLQLAPVSPTGQTHYQQITTATESIYAIRFTNNQFFVNSVVIESLFLSLQFSYG